VKVIELRNTCVACPAQWEGRTEDGKWVYVRYRWGWLSVCVGEGKDVSAAIRGDEVFGKDCGAALDGDMTFQELVQHTPGIHWPSEANHG